MSDDFKTAKPCPMSDEVCADCGYRCGENSLGAPIPIAWRIESAVRDVFEKRFINQVLPYKQARELVWLERELVDEIVFRLKEISDVAI